MDGAIVENYAGSTTAEDVAVVLEALVDAGSSIPLGVNILPNDGQRSICFAERLGGRFVQVDYVAGAYEGAPPARNLGLVRKSFCGICVLGGVWPKYYTPVQGSDLEKDLYAGMQNCDAIVVTGEGTGKETPLEKIRQFDDILQGEIPLIVGAGLTPENLVSSWVLLRGRLWEAI
jgi:predicted TIM-barrel enzyme